MKKRLVLKASAGTGKTYRLSLEYVAALCRGTDFKDILVMTFTKKATSEIKERILKFFSLLAGINEDKEEDRENLEKNILKLYPDIKFDRKKIKEEYTNLIENKDKLKIYTIDAFTNLIFRRAIAPYLKIYSYEIIDDDENEDILNKTFQRIFDNKADFEIFKGFLEDNSEKNMDSYRKLIKNLLDERWKVILLGNKLENRREKFQVTSNYEYFEKMIFILEKVAEIKGKELSEVFKKDVKNYLTLFDAKEKEKFILDNHKTILEKEFWSRTVVKTTKKINIDSEIEDLNYLYEEMKNNLAHTLFNNLIIPYEEKLLYIINRIYEVYDEIKFREKRFTHSDISSYTFKYIRDRELNFIDNNGVTDEFFEILDGKIDTIFIDEFQDTSILQWKILKDIIDQTDNVICVGDEKQSIYGWRGGEKKLFENLEDIINGTLDNLDISFRSEENIVNFCNDVFEAVSLATGEEEESRQWLFNKVAPKNNDHQGHIEVLQKIDENSVMDSIVDKLKNDFNGVYKGIGILARTNNHLNFIAEKLTEADIPFVIDSNSNIVETRGIKSLFSLINWLVKDDYLALLDFLRSDLVNMGTESVKYLIKNRENIESWLNNKDNTLLMKETDLELMKIIRSIKNSYIENNGETSFLTYDILKTTGIVERFNSKGDISNLYSFYKILKSYKYFEEFLVEFEDQKNSSKFKKMVLEDENSVSLMTIHKSKGLEFDTLFYYYCPIKKSNFNQNMKFFISIDKKYENVENFLLTHDKFNSVIKSLKDEFNYLDMEELKEKHEEINNLYVALTRPKNNLYIAIEKEFNPDEKDFITNIIFSFGDKTSQGNIVPSELKKVEQERKRKSFQLNLSTPESQYPDASESVARDLEKIYSDSLSNEAKRVRGSAVHFFLENIIYGTEEEIMRAKELTFSKFASILGESAIKELLAPHTIEYLLNKDPKLFSSQWDKIYTEYEIYDEDKTYRIDRLMIKEAVFNENEELLQKGVILIVDYKTGETDEDQIENYKNLISLFLKKQNKEEHYDIVTEFVEYTL